MMQDIGPLSSSRQLSAIIDLLWLSVERKCALTVGRIETARFRAKNLWHVDHQGLRYIQQNPRSNSVYAKRAQDGAKIVWVIRLRDNQYIGCVDEGRIWRKPGLIRQEGATS